MARGFNLTAELNLRGPSNIRPIVADIRRQLGTINANVNVRLDPGVARNIGALNQTFRAFNNTLQATNVSANATAISLRTLGTAIQQVNNRASNLPANLQQINNATQNVAQQNAAATAAVHTTTSAFREFGQQSALAVRRFAAFATVTGVIYKVSSALSSATTDFITFNQELVRVSQVTDTSVQNLGGLVAEITSLSTKFGVSSNELIKVSSTLAQAGLSARDTEKALKALALSSLAPSFDNLNSTVEGSIALMRQFGISAGELDRALGSVNAVAAKFAVEAGDIITAIQRTGGVFATASKGVSEGTQALNEFMAVFTSVRATTRESAETIATGLRTIFTRIQRGDTIDALKEYGVTLTDLQGKFVGPYEAVRRLSEGLSQLDPRDLKFSRIVEELGGFRQIGKVIPLIQQFATAQAALKVAQSGQDSLATDAATAQQSLAVQMAKVRNEFVGLVRSIGQSSGFQSFVKLSLDLTSNLIRLTDAAKGALPALGAIFAMRGLSAIGQFGRGFIGGMRPNRNSEGGPIRRFASGGYVPGFGNGDTVSAKLTPGEFVMSRPAVQAIGVGRLHSLNRSRGGSILPNKYYQGGVAALKKLSPGESGNRISDYLDPYQNQTSKTNKEETGRKKRSNRESPKMLRGFQLKDNVNSNIKREVITPLEIKNAIGNNKNFRGYINSRAAKDKSREFYAAQGIAFEEFLFNKILSQKGYTKAPTKTYPLDFIPKSDEIPPAEAKFTYEQVPDAFILNKRLRYNLRRRDKLSPLTRRERPDNIQLGPTVVYEMQAGLKNEIFSPNATKIQKQERKARANEGLLKIDKLGLKRNAGGQIQRFMAGDVVEPPATTTVKSSAGEIIKALGLQKAASVGGIGAPDVRRILNKRTELTVAEATAKDAILAEFTKKQKLDASAKKGGQTRRRNAATAKGLVFGVAGLFGNPLTPNPLITTIQDTSLKDPNKQYPVSIYSGIYKNQKEASRIDKRFDKNIGRSSDREAKRSKKLEMLEQKKRVRGILGGFESGRELALDFDKTLAFGAMPVRDPNSPRFSEFSDAPKVNAALAKAKLSVLGRQLVSLVGKKPELLKNVRIITARPKATLPLLQTWLTSKGLPIQAGQFKGFGGPTVSGSDIAKLKAAELNPGSIFVDDNKKNADAAKQRANEGIDVYRYRGVKKLKDNTQPLEESEAVKGGLLEGYIRRLGAVGSKKGNGFDFMNGLGPDVAKKFKPRIPSNIPTDIKRTIVGLSTVKDNIVTYLKNVKGYNSGGAIQRFPQGGTPSPAPTPRLIQRGGFKYELDKIIAAGFTEAQFMKQIPVPGGYGEQWQIGGMGEGSIPMPPSIQPYKAPPSDIQRRVGEATINGMGSFARGGGVSVFRGPGSGTSDSIGPIGLPVGSFIIRAAATKSLGLRNGGSVGGPVSAQEFAAGGTVQRFGNGSPGGVPIKNSSDPVSRNKNWVKAEYASRTNKVTGGVFANKIGPGLYAVDTAGVSKPGQGYGVPLYDSVLQQVSAMKGWLTSSRTQVSKQARAVWDGYRKKRQGDVKNKLLPMEQWNMDPLFNGQTEGEPLNDLAYQFPENLNDLKKHKKTWPPKNHPVWSLQHAYQFKAKAIKKFIGGTISKFASGGSVPALVSNGEAYIPPKEAKNIGLNKLRAMNQADRNGMKSFARGGGVSVFRGPGSDTSDSIGPIELPIGSFILRAAATRALGLSGGGSVGVQQFASGGAVHGIQKFAGGGRPAPGDAEARIQKVMMDLEMFGNALYEEAFKLNRSKGMRYQEAREKAQETARVGRNEYANDKAVNPRGPGFIGPLNRTDRSDVGAASARIIAQEMQKASRSSQQVTQSSRQTQTIFQAVQSVASKTAGAITTGVSSLKRRFMRPSDEEVGNMSANQRAQYENKRNRRDSYMNTGLALAFAAPMVAEAAGAAFEGSTGKGVAAAGTAIGGAVAIGAQLGPIGMVAGAFVGLALAMDSFHKAVAEADIDLSKKKIETSATTAEAQLEKLNKNPRDAALTSSIVKNLKDISAEEEKISAKQAELRQPSLLTRGLETASFGRYKATRPTNEQIAEEQTANQKVGGEIALKTLTAKVESGLNIEQALSSFGGDKDLAKLNIAQTNKKFNLENQKLENIKKTPGQDPQIIADIEKRQKELVNTYFKEETATQQATVAERARVQALQQSARVLNLSSVSIAKTFENMDQAIDSATTGLDRASQRIDDIASGQVSLKTQFKSTDILKNPNAYSQKERQAAVGQVSGMFGKDQNFVEGLSKFGASAEDTITKISVKAQQNSNGDSGTLGEDITRDLTKQLIDTFGDNRISDAIRDQLKNAVKDNIKNNDGVLDPQSLIDSVGGLKQLIDSQKKAFDTMMKQYAFIEKALDTYGNAVQKAAELQTQAVAKFASLQGYLADSRVSLREALGEGRRTSLSERSSGRYTEAAINAGMKPGSLTAANLTNQRNNLLNQRSAVENNTKKLENSGNLADPAVISLIAKQKDALASLNRQIEATEKGLDGLPDLIKQDLQDTLSKIGQLVQERESRTQAGASFGEKLVTSTPTELNNLNATYDLLNRTLNGQITTIHQSVSAQQAYRKTIQDGGTHLEAMTAAQDAFAGDAKNAFSLFNEMIQVSGLDTTDKQRANSLRADLIQNTARAQGLNVENNPFLKEIIANLRAAPAEDPQIKALENLYKQQQMALGEATQRAINPLLEKQGQILNTANTALISALDKLTNAFNGAQTNNQNLGLARPGTVMTRSQGGPVYAAGGTLVNYEPRGTDTVPAMLTPGEFVVNRQATQRNLPLLRSINAGNYAKGGVVYLMAGSASPVQTASQIDPLVASLISGSDDAGEALNVLTRSNRYMNSGINPNNPLFRLLLAIQSDPAMTGAIVKREWQAAVQASPLGLRDPIFQPYIQEIGEAREATLRIKDVPDPRKPININPNGLEHWLGIKPIKPATKPTMMSRIGDTLDNVYQGARSAVRNLGPGLANGVRGFATNNAGSLTSLGAGVALSASGVDEGTSHLLTTAGEFGVRFGQSFATAAGDATLGSMATTARAGTASTIALNTGIDAIRTGAEFLYDRKAFHQNRVDSTRHNETSMIGGALQGFARPINTMVEMGYTEASRQQAVAEAEAGEAKTNSMLQNSRKPKTANDHLGAFELNVMDRRDAERLAEFNIESRRLEKGAKPRKDAVGNLMTQAFIDQQISNIYDSLNSQDTMARPFQSDTKVNKGRGTHVDDSTFQAAVSAQEQHLERQRVASEEVRIAKIEKQKQAAQAAEDRKKEQELEKQRVQARAGSSVFRMDGRDVDAATIETDTLMRGDQYGLTTAAKQGKNKVDTANRTRNQAENQRQANRWVHQPATPGPVKLKNGQTIDPNKQTQSLNKKKKDKELELDQYSFVDPADMTEDQKKDKERLLRERDQINSEIIKLNNTIAVDVPMRERDQQWKMHGKKQERDANKAQIAASNRANAKRFRLELAVGQAVGMGAPNKFTSPEAFMSWRGQALSKLKKKFNLTGSNKIDEKLLTQYGLSAGAAQDLFHPFTPDQAEALIQAMSQETSGGNYKYSDRDISILRMNPDQIEALALRINNGDTYLQGNMDERKKLEKAQEKTFVKLLRNFSGIDRMAARGQGMNRAQQAMLKTNISKQLTKMGYINPQNSDEDNAARLAPFNINNTVGFLYPQVAAGNPAFRSSGGMIYASEGKLINYQPRGTDTVPAMLTPGEFVVNAKATSQNLPLLQSINKSSGGVIYRAEGGGSDAFSNRQQTSSAEKSGSIRATELNTRLQQQIANNTNNTANTVPIIAKTTAETANKQIPTLSNKTSLLEQNNANAFSNINTKTANISNITSTIPGFDKTSNEKLDELLRRTEVLPNILPALLNIQALLLFDQQQQANGVLGQFGPEQNRAIGNAGMDAMDFMLRNIMGFSSGGMVYASNGMMIPYEPRGTDTVPAMLTPGEFVVNRASTQANLPLLQSINQSKGGDIKGFADGGVVYAANGEQIRDAQQKARERQEAQNKRIRDKQQLEQDKNNRIRDRQQHLNNRIQARKEVKNDKLRDQDRRRPRPLTRQAEIARNENSLYSQNLDSASENKAVWMYVDKYFEYQKTVGSSVDPEAWIKENYPGVKDARMEQFLNSINNMTQIKIKNNVPLYSSGGIVYAQNGRQMPLPDAQSRKNESYAPFKTLRDKQLAERKSAYEKAQQEKAVRSRLEQGARFYINQDEMERRRKEENSPEAAQERQQRAVDRSSRSSTGSGFGEAGIRYDRSGRPYAKGGVVYAAGGGEMTKIPEPPIDMPLGFAPQKGFTVPLDKTKAIQAHQQSEKYRDDPFSPEADRAWKSFGRNPVEIIIDDLHELAQDRLGGNKLAQIPGAAVPAFGVGPPMMARRFVDNSIPAKLQTLHDSLLYDPTKGGQGLENYLDQYKDHFAPNAPYGAQPMSPNKDSLIPQTKAMGGIVYAQDGFDPSRPLNPMINRQGKGSASTLTSSPISNFNNEKLAEEAKAAGYGAAKSVLPGLAGLGAGVLGLPTTGPGGFAIGLGAGAAVYQAQENYLNAFAPETNKQMKDTTEEHWQSALLGSMVSGFGVDKAGRKLLSPAMKNTPRMPAILPNNNASVRPDMKSASQEAMEEFSLRSKPGIQAPSLLNKSKPEGLLGRILTDLQQTAVYDRILLDQPVKAVSKNQGGMIYASRGTLVNYQPRGTDTVPAMLTPGEFVVNRQATQQNLPLLQSINGGVNHMSRGGMTYLSEGGMPGVSSGGISNLGQIFTTLSQSTQKFTNSLQLAISTLSDYQKQLSSGTTNSVSNNTGSNNPNMDGLSQFTNTFNKFIGQLAALNLPPEITIQGTHKVDVVINGASVFANMESSIRGMIVREVEGAMNKLAIQTEGVLRT